MDGSFGFSLVFWLFLWLILKNWGQTEEETREAAELDVRAQDLIDKQLAEELEILPTSPEPDPILLELPVPGSHTLRRRFNLLFRSRKCGEDEFYTTWGPGIDGLSIHFPVPRRLLTVRIALAGCQALPVFHLKFHHRETPQDLLWTGHWMGTAQGADLVIRICDTRPVTKIEVGLPEVPPAVQGQIQFRLLKGHDEDREILAAGIRALNLGSLDLGLERLNSFEDEWSQANPAVIYNLGQVMMAMDQPVMAQYHAVRLMSLNLVESGFELYHRIPPTEQWRSSPAEVRGDQTHLKDWELAGHHGLVTLSAKRRFVVGINGWHWEKSSEVHQVLRRAAARKMRRIVVPFEEGRTLLIQSEVRIHRHDGKLFNIPSDRFSVGPAEDDNPFIQVARRRAGQWLLPDLEVGDAVEVNFSLLHRDRGEADEGGLFLISNFSSGAVPIFQGQVEVLNPHRLDLDFVPRNGAPEPEVSQDRVTGFQKFVFTGHRLLPRINTGHPFENSLFNPLLACRVKGETWEVLAENLFEPTFAALDHHTAPPPPLLEVLAGSGDPREALARAFYWIRDRIKYGSIDSVNRMIRSEVRAAHLVAAGIGDCKDKSFLLALVCRHLGLEFDLVLVSTDHGLIVEELPADQFNHIILRAKLPDRWVYLDAAADEATFGNIPIPLQGLQGLISGQGGTLITIPNDLPDRNRVRISEEIGEISDGWLMTDIELVMEGHLARFFDESWKNLSLNSPGTLKAAEASFRIIFPDLVVTDFQRRGDTSDSDLCRFTCQGRRGRLVGMGDHDLASFGWSNPGLNTEWVRRLNLQDEFTFPFCHEFDFRVRFAGGARSRLEDLSRLEVCQAGFGGVNGEVSEDSDSLILQRRITVDKRTVPQDEMAHLPDFLTAIEDGLRVVGAFDREGR